MEKNKRFNELLEIHRATARRGRKMVRWAYKGTIYETYSDGYTEEVGPDNDNLYNEDGE